MPPRGDAGRVERERAVGAARALFAERYPRLRFSRNADGTAVARGPIELELPDGGLDPVDVGIVFGSRYPAKPPDAYDAAGRWPVDPNRHIVAHHRFCLYFDRVDEPDMRAPDALAAWMVDLVLFLHQQLVCDAIGGRRFPGLEWPHREQPAYAQHLLETLRAFSPDERADAWHTVRARRTGRNWPCPCRSGRKIKRCHLATFAELERIARRAGLTNASYDELRDTARGA